MKYRLKHLEVRFYRTFTGRKIHVARDGPGGYTAAICSAQIHNEYFHDEVDSKDLCKVCLEGDYMGKPCAMAGVNEN